MIQQSKWISDLTGDIKVSDAARRVLTLRLAAVRDWLGQSLRQAGKDTENVHQLRVATRRASAALDVFADCLPSKVAKSAKNQLKSIRRAAGEARDWDVFLSRLNDLVAEQPVEDRTGFDMLIGYALAHRIPAQRKLEKACPHYPFGFERFMAEILSAIRSKGANKQTLVEFGRPLLARLLGRLSKLDLREVEDCRELHQIRILGKRLRYALEIFVDCFGSGLPDKLYPAVAELQVILGSVNDHYNAAALYTALDTALRTCLPAGARRYRGLIDRLLKEHEAHLPAGRRKVIQWHEGWMQPEIQIVIAEIVAPCAIGQRVSSIPQTQPPLAPIENPPTASEPDLPRKCA